MRIKAYIIGAMLATCLPAVATSVVSTAGELAKAVGSDTLATSLSVTGVINAADVEFIANRMPLLSSLDLSGTTIAEYDGEPIITGRTRFEANTMPAYSLMGNSLESLKLPSGLTEIDEGALAATAIKSIEIPATVTTLGDGAFSNCDNLTAVTIPASVTSIGQYTFMDCDALATVVIGNGISTIGNSTFARCRALCSISLQDGLQHIGNKAFAGCSSLASIELPSSITSIGDEAFAESGLTTIDLSTCGGLSTIGDWAFARCDALESVKLNDNTSYVGEGAFFDDTRLASYTTPTAVSTVNRYTHKGNISINSETLLHSGITTIGDYALAGMSHIAKFDIPAMVDSIGSNAFEGWTALSHLRASELNTVPALGSTVWQGVSQHDVTLYVKDELVDAFSSTAQWQDFKVTGVSSVGKDDIMVSTGNSIKVYFVESTLVIKAENEIAGVMVYDSSGRRYAGDTPDNDTSHTIDTSAWNCRLYIVNVTLNNGTNGVFKIAR